MSMTILDMPTWKSKVLNFVAWILGYRGEHAYVILMNINLNNPEEAKEFLNDTKS